jgi:CTP synthase
VLICRTRLPISQEMKNKISLFCDVATEAVIETLDAETIYEVPLMFEDAGLADLVVKRLQLPQRPADLAEWREIVERIKRPKYEVNVAVVGKYIENGDAYISISEALKHGGIANDARVNLQWIDSVELEHPDATDILSRMDAILVAPGFGARGVEGKILAADYARDNGVPFLGICYGMQMAVIAYARSVLGLKEAHTEEVAPDTPHALIHILPEQREIVDKGATMRLGAYKCQLKSGSLAERLYGAPCVYERHRHRYELNNDYREELARFGLVCSGLSPDYRLVEIIEIPSHPYFIATQFHPEFRSRPNRAHPLFSGLIAAAIDRSQRSFIPDVVNESLLPTASGESNGRKRTQRGNGRAEMNVEMVEALEL